MKNRARRRRFWVAGAAIALLTVAAYWPVSGFEFVNFDDLEYLPDNPQVRNGLSLKGVVWAASSFHRSNWHPLTWLSHMTDVQLFGMNPGAHHLVNLGFHVAASLLLLATLASMTGAFWGSALTAALFALHPLHVESVAWVAERKDVLSAFLFFLSLAAYLRYARKPGAARYFALVGSFALALLAKPMALTLPFVLLLLDWWPLGRLRRRSAARVVVEKLPLAAMSLASGVVTVLAQRNALTPLESLPMAGRLGNAAVSYLAYLRAMLLPWNLVFLYPLRERPIDAVVTGCLAALAMVTLLALVLGRRRPYLPVGWFWYLGMLLPVIGLVQVGRQAMADRYTYLPLVGIFLTLAWLLREASARSRAAAAAAIAAGAAVLLLAAVTRVQVGYWKNDATLFGHAVAVIPDNSLAYDNLGIYLSKLGRFDEAARNFRMALSIVPEDSAVSHRLGIALGQLGRWEEALAALSEAVRRKPDQAEYLSNMAYALAQLGRDQDAAFAYRRLVQVSPRDPQAYLDLAQTYYRLGLPAEAADAYRAALALEPGNVFALYSLSAAMGRLGRPGEAAGVLRRVVELNPRFAQAHYDLGVLCLQLGERGEAEARYRVLERLDPSLAAELRRLLGTPPAVAR